MLGTLHQFLHKEGVDCCVVMSFFSSISKEYKSNMKKIDEFTVKLGWRNRNLALYELIYKDIVFYFLYNEYYFKRDNPCGYFDDGQRIAFFSKAIITLIMREIFKWLAH